MAEEPTNVAPPAAEIAKPKKPKGRRFKNAGGKPKPQIAELKETEKAPPEINCIEYFDDEACLLAEENIASEIKDTFYTDNEWNGMDAIYKDFSKPPLGALPADLIRWCRISALEVTGMDKPELFPAIVKTDDDDEDGEKKDDEEKKEEGGSEEGDDEGNEGKEGKSESLPSRLDDLVQGQLENRWWLTAVSPLLNLPTYLGNLFVSKRYAAKGLYTVKFFKDGRWRYVHIDDLIPCDMAGVPLFSRSKNQNATWILLLEKAYAKLHGCYERLGTGVVEEGMRDLTLGVACAFSIPAPALNEKGEGVADTEFGTGSENDPTTKLWSDLSSIIPANKDNRHVLRMKNSEGIAVVVRTKDAAPMKSGRAVDPRRSVMTGRGYAVRLMLTLEDPETKSIFRFVALRNPWGLRSWGGDWGHGDVKWDENPRIKGLISSLAPEYTWNPDDGIFWMSWSDFCVQFDRVRAVRLPSSDWTLNRFQGEWLADSITDGRGGRPGSPDFSINPMFGFEYRGGSVPKCMISVSQKETRWRADEGAPLRTSDVSSSEQKRLPAIGFAIVKLTGDHLRLHEYWRGKVVATSELHSTPYACVRSRDVANAMLTITEGRYALVPFTYESGEGGGGNAFYIDLWSDYELQIFECFQEDAVSEVPDSDEDEDGEEASETKGDETENLEEKDGDLKIEKDAKVDKEPDFMTLQLSQEDKENLEELTLMAMQRTISDLCVAVKDIRKEISDLNVSVRKISATR
jgi:hypothetical protein